MSHADVLVCIGNQQQEAGPSFQYMEGLIVVYISASKCTD